MVDLTQIIIAVLTLVASLISAFLVPYIKSKVTTEQLKTIEYWVKVAVGAAEMKFKGSGRGAEKKKHVLDFLESKGFKLNTEEIDNMLEDAVFKIQ